MNMLLGANFTVIADVVALVAIVASIVVGAIRGFAKTFINAFGGILSLLFAVLLCKSVATFLQYKFGFIDTVTGWVTGSVTAILGDGIANTTLAEATESSLSAGGVAFWIINLILQAQGNEGIPKDVTINQVVSPVFGYYIVCIIALVVLYVLFRILFFLLGEIIQKSRDIKLIGATDTVLGAAIGLIRGVFIIQFALLLLSVLPVGGVQEIYSSLSSSSFCGFINKTNVFDAILKAISSVNVVDYITEFISKLSI